MTEVSEPENIDEKGSSAVKKLFKAQQEEIASRRKRKLRGQRIHERLDLDQTMKKERARRRRHPAGHGRGGLPTGWTSAGPRPERPGE